MTYMLVVMLWTGMGEPMVVGSFHPSAITCWEAGLNAQIKHGKRMISWSCELAPRNDDESIDG